MSDAPAPIPQAPNPIAPDPKKRKRKRLLLLLLLLLFLGGGGTATWVVIQKLKPPTYLLQGETEIRPGNIVMKIWDSEAEDGDVIQVFFQGKLVVDQLAILNTPVEYKLGWLTAGEYEIRVRPLNEGSSPPASARISLSDGKVEQEFDMSASAEYAASWKVIVREPSSAPPKAPIFPEVPKELDAPTEPEVPTEAEAPKEPEAQQEAETPKEPEAAKETEG